MKKRLLTILIMGLFMFSMSFCTIAADNTATIENIIVDKTSPKTPTLGGTSENWVKEDVTVTVSNIEDPVSNGVSSGVEKVEYSVGETTGEDKTGGQFTITVSTEGMTEVTAKTIDKVGNESELASGTIKLDKTPPEITISGVKNDETYHIAVNPTFSANDNLSDINGIPTATLAKDGGAATGFISGNEINAPGTYTLKVTATDNAGNIATETITFTLGTVTMEGVDIDATAKSPTSIEISWTAVDNATGYKVFEDETELANITTGTSYTHENLGVNTQHTYKVVPYNALGGGTASNTVSVYTLANVPTGLKATDKTSTTLTVTWEANGNPEGTEYSASIDGTTWTGFVANKLTHEFTGLIVGKSYIVDVKARNGDGIETEPVSITENTNTAPIITITSPEPGTAYSDVVGHNIITISGTVTDVDNDDVTVTATINGVSKSIVVEQCQVTKDFTIEFSVAEIPEGKYSITVTASDGK